ncbi:uncharacterized protein LOC116288170 [Actinia tenebrosa]|uniref:Uncharacterized protein LOC116288170 n=1 Tax=Actinia tenebrosa TaxID=6105 RepID=A0A6P8HDR4_ACTTE|nr:uncharacterized protein LOC116288170 [Actinia tenebrosa]
MLKLTVLVVIMALNLKSSSSNFTTTPRPPIPMTCPTCQHGRSYDDCQSKATSYQCENIGNTFTMCKIQCNKGQGNWEFGCATPNECEIQKHYCTRTGECNIACCDGPNCIQGNPNMTDPCRGSLTHAPKAIVVGACVAAGLYAMHHN